MPAGLTSISYYAFAGCSSLTEIVIPEGVKSIGQYAFSGCENLETITIPESVTHIRQGAFDGCAGLKTVAYAGTEEQWNGIQIGEGNEILFEVTMN